MLIYLFISSFRYFFFVSLVVYILAHPQVIHFALDQSIKWNFTAEHLCLWIVAATLILMVVIFILNNLIDFNITYIVSWWCVCRCLLVFNQNRVQWNLDLKNTTQKSYEIAWLGTAQKAAAIATFCHTWNLKALFTSVRPLEARGYTT